MAMPQIKIVIAGPEHVGSSSLLKKMMRPEFEFEGAWFNNSPEGSNQLINGHAYHILIWDESMQPMYSNYEGDPVRFDPDVDHLRRLRARQKVYESLERADVVVVLYAATSCDSVIDVRKIVLPEVRRGCPDAAIMLVRTMDDLLKDTQKEHADFFRLEKELLDANAQLRAFSCSVWDGTSVQRVSEAAIEAYFENTATKRTPSPKKCCALL